MPTQLSLMQLAAAVPFVAAAALVVVIAVMDLYFLLDIMSLFRLTMVSLLATSVGCILAELLTFAQAAAEPSAEQLLMVFSLRFKGFCLLFRSDKLMLFFKSISKFSIEFLSVPLSASNSLSFNSSSAVLGK